MEITIKRSTDKPTLTADDFKRAVVGDTSLSGGEGEPLMWTDPVTGQKRYINVAPESGEFSTDDVRGDDDSICRFVDKLRDIARILDARVTCEGEDITEQTPAPPKRTGCASIIVCAVSFIAVAVFILLSFR